MQQSILREWESSQAHKKSSKITPFLSRRLRRQQNKKKKKKEIKQWNYHRFHVSSLLFLLFFAIFCGKCQIDWEKKEDIWVGLGCVIVTTETRRFLQNYTTNRRSLWLFYLAYYDESSRGRSLLKNPLLNVTMLTASRNIFIFTQAIA